jgi:competence protein ComEA
VVQQQRIIISASNLYRRNTVGVAFLLGLLYVFSIIRVSAQQPVEQQQVHAQEDTGFPDGPGKDILFKTCSRCHSPNLVMANRQDRNGWENTITKMVSLGAVGTDEDFTAVLDYLVRNFPQQSKINVNKATVAELEAGLSFSTKEAEAVVAYRNKNGDFKFLGDLKKVPQLDTKKVDAKVNRLIFQ